MNKEIKVFTAIDENGQHLVAHLGNPRFCVGGATNKEALDKAARAIEYFNSVVGSENSN